MKMLKNGLLLSCLLLLGSGMVQAQIDTLKNQLSSPKGVIGISQPDLIDKLMITLPGLGSNARDMLEEQSVKPYMLPPRNHGQLGSPNAYVLAACLEFYVNFDQNFKVNLSPEFISLNLPQEDMMEALQFLTLEGTVSAAIVPYQAVVLNSAVRATAHYRTANYLYLYRGESRGRQKVFETRKALMRGNPVIVELQVPEEFLLLKDTRLWEGGARGGSHLLPMLVVGYEEEKEAFELMGTLGNKWASNGYIWLSYDDFGQMAQNGFVLVPQETY